MASSKADETEILKAAVVATESGVQDSDESVSSTDKTVVDLLDEV
jgi:hypothetical protein